jgi:hypothetical protein
LAQQDRKSVLKNASKGQKHLCCFKDFYGFSLQKKGISVTTSLLPRYENALPKPATTGSVNDLIDGAGYARTKLDYSQT